MKRLSLRFACVFIILIFCLAPLSAVDLNQDNNTKYINQDDNDDAIAVDDVNITEVDVDNETVEIDTKGNDSQNKSLDSRSPYLYACIINVPYGKNPIVHVVGDPELTGRISINCPDFENSYKVPIEYGGIYYEIKEDLHPGRYEVQIAYGGNSVFDPQEVTEAFYVYEAKPDLKVNVDSVPCDKNVIVNIDGHQRLNGTVELKLNNSKTYQVKMVDGKGEIALGNLSPGKYKASVVFAGNEFFESGKAESEFTVLEKYNPNMSLNIDDCTLSEEKLHVVIHADERFTGNVTLKLNGRVYVRQVEVIDGYGEGYYPNEHFAGNYTAVASTEGNDLFYAENCSTTYIVKDN